MLRRIIFISAIATFYILHSTFFAFATEFSSTSYKVLDPVINDAGVEMTSTSYKLRGTLGELALGRSTATSYTALAGSLGFPVATVPVLTATAGSTQVALSWTASQGSLGWSVSGYDACTGTASDSYTCENAGNVTSFTKTGLTASTPYFFRVRAKDVFGNVIVRSNEATATPTAATSSDSGGGTGGNAGGSTTSGPTTSDVILSGRAYPAALVSLFQNGVLKRQVTAGSDGTFSGRIESVQTGQSYTFGLNAKDAAGRTSVLITYTINIPTGVQQTGIENIFIPPTIELSDSSVAVGEPIEVRGIAFPGSLVRIEIPSVPETITTATSSGTWSTRIDTSALPAGTYSVRAKAQMNSDQSETSVVEMFTIASSAQPEVVPGCRGSDVNADGSINLSDISILLSFWQQQQPSNACADINQDGIVNLTDFSVLLFNWTG